MEENNKNFGYFNRNEEEKRKLRLRSARYASTLQFAGSVKDDRKQLKKLNPEERSIELNRLRRERASDVQDSGFKSSRNVNKAKKLLEQSYRRIKRHQRPIWLLNLTIALTLDFLVDILYMLPWVGWIVGAICAFLGGVYLTCSLWRTGNRKTRTKKRVMRVAMLILDAFPYIGILPLSTATVFIAYKDSKTQADKAKKTIEEIKKEHPNLVIN